MTTRLLLVRERRDKRGRRIGHNWWREYNCQMLRDYNDAIDTIDGANHQMEPDEFRAAHPKVTLKELLIGNAGMARQSTETTDEAA